MAQATRSTDPRRHTPQFQEYQEWCTTSALDGMRLQPKKKEIPQPIITRNDYLSEASSDRRQHQHPRPPTPPRRSQKRLGQGEEEKAAAREGSQVGGGPLEEGTDEDCTKGGDSRRPNRLYTKEELVILTRKIFGDEEEEEDGEFWDAADGAPWAPIDHPAEDEGASVDPQDQESDIGGQLGEGEGEANEESKLDGLFGPTSNLCLSTHSKDGLLGSHQDEDNDQDDEVVQDVLESAANPATVNTSDGVNSSSDDTPPSTTASTPLTSPEYPRTALRPSPPPQHPPPQHLPPQHPPPLDNSFGTLSTIDDALVGNLQPGASPDAHIGVNDDLSDPVPVPAHANPSGELEPCKPAVAIPNEDESHCNAIRRIIRKRGLPEFSPTRPGIFSAVITHPSDDASLGKRKRSREDDGDDGEKASNPASVPHRDHQDPCPR